MTETKTKPARRFAREPKPQDDTRPADMEPSIALPSAALTPKPPTKSAIILELLQRDGGATLGELVAATDWLPHTTRAALTGVKRKGHALTSEKVDGVRSYHIPAGMPSA